MEHASAQEGSVRAENDVQPKCATFFTALSLTPYKARIHKFSGHLEMVGKQGGGGWVRGWVPGFLGLATNSSFFPFEASAELIGHLSTSGCLRYAHWHAFHQQRTYVRAVTAVSGSVTASSTKGG